MKVKIKIEERMIKRKNSNERKNERNEHELRKASRNITRTSFNTNN